MLRDIRRTKGQFFAVLTMIILGVAILAAVYGAYANMRSSVDDTYDELNFADFVVAFQSAPESVGGDVAALDGVAEVDARLVLEVPVTFAGIQEPVVGRLVSVPADGHPLVNDVRIEKGRYPVAGAREVVLERRFAEHHGIEVGATLYVTNSSGAWPYTVTGMGVSPEYLWPAKTPREHMPDILRRWGVLFVPLPDIQALAGMNGSVNQVAVVMDAGADQEKVLGDVMETLAPYGITEVVDRENQPSDMIIRLTMDMLSQLAFILPLFFLLIVALSTNVLLTRLVYVQRTNIGMLRALGYSRGSMLRHYLAFALILGLSGSILGYLLGYALSYPVTDLFSQSVNLSNVPVRPQLELLAIGVGLSIAFTAVAGIVPAWRASRLRPAEAMRPPVPAWGRRSRLGRIFPGRPRIPTSWKHPVRNVLRNRRRTAFTILGLALAVSVLVVPLSFLDSMNWVTDSAFDRIQRYDMKVYLQMPHPLDNLTSLESWEEISVAEPAIDIPTSVVRDGETYSVLVTGFASSTELYGLYDRSWEPVTTVDDGILLARVYEKHGFRVGDQIEMLSQSVEVKGFVSDFGTTGFVTLDTAQRWLGMNGTATSVMLELAPGADEQAVRARLFASLPVLAVESTDQVLSDWNEMLALFYGFIYMLLIFGVAIALAIVYNAVTMNVMEEGRELATMRTLGTPRSVLTKLVTAETLLLIIPGAILGLILGTYLTGYFTSLYSSDLFVLDPVIYPQTYIVSFAAAVLVALLSEWPSLRNVRRMNLAKVTKERVS
jgi:putative ABC transport system permease protein